MDANRDAHPIHNVSIALTGNYSISITRKGNPKLLFDKNSLSCMLVLDTESSKSGRSKSETRLPLSIRKFKVSKDMERISYAGSVQSERLGGKVSGRLK